MIRVAEEDYIIEPYKQHRFRPSFDPISGPHKLYKRSAINMKQTQFCGKSTSTKFRGWYHTCTCTKDWLSNYFLVAVRGQAPVIYTCIC